jgi:hypothetical protein
VVFLLYEFEDIGYLVLRDLNTASLPCEGFSENWLFDNEAQSTFILETGVGDGSIWKLLQCTGKRLSFRKTRGEKERNS